MKHSYKDCVKVVHEKIISLTKECLLEEQNYVNLEVLINIRGLIKLQDVQNGLRIKYFILLPSNAGYCC